MNGESSHTQLILYTVVMLISFVFGQDFCKGYKITFIKGDKRKMAFERIVFFIEMRSWQESS